MPRSTRDRAAGGIQDFIQSLIALNEIGRRDRSEERIDERFEQDKALREQALAEQRRSRIASSVDAVRDNPLRTADAEIQRLGVLGDTVDPERNFVPVPGTGAVIPRPDAQQTSLAPGQMTTSDARGLLQEAEGSQRYREFHAALARDHQLSGPALMRLEPENQLQILEEISRDHPEVTIPKHALRVFAINEDIKAREIRERNDAMRSQMRAINEVENELLGDRVGRGLTEREATMRLDEKLAGEFAGEQTKRAAERTRATTAASLETQAAFAASQPEASFSQNLAKTPGIVKELIKPEHLEEFQRLAAAGEVIPQDMFITDMSAMTPSEIRQLATRIATVPGGLVGGDTVDQIKLGRELVRFYSEFQPELAPAIIDSQAGFAAGLLAQASPEFAETGRLPETEEALLALQPVRFGGTTIEGRKLLEFYLELFEAQQRFAAGGER